MHWNLLLDLRSEMSGFTESEVGNKAQDEVIRSEKVIPVSLPAGADLSVPQTTEQESFQPGSTPMNLKCRYLVSVSPSTTAHVLPLYRYYII